MQQNIKGSFTAYSLVKSSYAPEVLGAENNLSNKKKKNIETRLCEKGCGASVRLTRKYCPPCSDDVRMANFRSYNKSK